MQSDVHEPWSRRPPYAKRPDDEAMLAAVNAALQGLPLQHAPSGADTERLPIVYVVGAPRSGTTLLSQLLSRHLPIGYINNLIARFWLRPSVGIRLSNLLLGERGREGIAFESTHGVTSGILGPHEFGYFWRHWLRLDRSPTHHLSPAALAEIDRVGLKRVLEEEILGVFQTGVVLKNGICGFHAGFLTGIHPVSLFVHITREPFDAAASVLKCRQERFGSYQAWWSLKPATYPFGPDAGDPVAEAASQVLDCKKEIDVELALPGVNGMRVTYEDLCADPQDVVKRVCVQLAEMGIEVSPVSMALPRLSMASTPRLPDDLERRLRERLEQAVLRSR
jgi:LPS sulfotransferase NodH